MRSCGWPTLTIMLLVELTTLPGCIFRRPDPYAQQSPCHIAPNLPLTELVQHLNQNTNRLNAFRATKVKVKLPGFPQSEALLAVEAPRNFRLIVNSLVGSEADLGSNNERFWFWIRRSEDKHVFTSRHDQIGQSQQRLPFEPDWLIEVLGVTPLEEMGLTMEPGPPGSNRANLVCERVTPQGDPVKKIVVVDTCHGVIVEHALYNSKGRLIARAVLSQHRQHPPANAVLPSHIDIEWPMAQMKLAMDLLPIEVNPPQIPAQTFAMPVMADYPVKDLGEPVARRERDESLSR